MSVIFALKLLHFVGLLDPLQRQAGAKRGSKRISIFLEIRAGSACVQKKFELQDSQLSSTFTVGDNLTFRCLRLTILPRQPAASSERSPAVCRQAT